MTIKHQIGKVVIPLLPVNRKVFSILRFELNAFVTRVLNLCAPSYLMKKNQIRKMKGICINLGSGGRGESGWINIDALRHHADQSLAYDIRRGLPFRDGQAKRIFAEHVVEHIEFYEEVPRLFKHCYRVLEPGGYFRIIVPDARRWVEAYVSDDPSKWQALGMSALPQGMPTKMAMINHVFHQGGEHQFGYDFETLAHLLEEAGFKDVVHSSFRTSADPELNLDREEHKAYSLYVEARK